MTLADLFEYLQSCDSAVVSLLPAEGEPASDVDERVFKTSDILMDFLSVQDIMHLRMVCKSTAQVATP